MSILSFAICAFTICANSSPAFSDNEKTIVHKNNKEQTAIKFVNDAVDLYETKGLDVALNIFRDLKGDFCTQYEYGYEGINVITSEGILLASCKYPGLVGNNILGWKTPDGKLINQVILQTAKENPCGIIIGEDITNLNPETGQQTGFKHFARTEGDLIFFTHIYNPIPIHKQMPSFEDVKKAQNPKNGDLEGV